jgi:hypothetical protein
MTKREAAIVSAYTGCILGEPSELHKYAEEKLGRSIFRYEIALAEIAKELRVKSREDFKTIKVK